MSHCRGARGSGATDDAATRSTHASPPTRAWRADRRSAAESLSTMFGFLLGFSWPFGSAVPIGRLRAAPSRARSRRTLIRKAGSTDVTVATPTAVFSRTMTPPALRTASRAAASETPSSYKTTYSCCGPFHVAATAGPAATTARPASASTAARTIFFMHSPSRRGSVSKPPAAELIEDSMPDSRRLHAIVGLLRELVERESPTGDPGVRAVAERMAAELRQLGSDVQFLGDHVRAELGGSGPPLLLLGHTDTVWPRGTLATMPFRIEDGVAYGPGVYDMKGGLAILVEGLRRAGTERRAVRVFLTADEEQGAVTGKPLLEEAAVGLAAAPVLE